MFSGYTCIFHGIIVSSAIKLCHFSESVSLLTGSLKYWARRIKINSAGTKSSRRSWTDPEENIVSNKVVNKNIYIYILVQCKIICLTVEATVYVRLTQSMYRCLPHQG